MIASLGLGSDRPEEYAARWSINPAEPLNGLADQCSALPHHPSARPKRSTGRRGSSRVNLGVTKAQRLRLPGMFGRLFNAIRLEEQEETVTP